ncbi:2'-deoxycytidine 5'-triphosphate deaminase [Candidatus Woesearchaeota archaeon]|nr:2'-deoxycytidine 5'-triphosphate deaminase [Candidatus Woesearchaeota archaeon]
MNGVFSSQHIQGMIEQGQITAENPILPDQVQPSSFDLRLGNVGYRVPASFLLSKGGRVQEKLEQFAKDYYKFSLKNDAFLEARKTYVFELQERIALPPGVKARCNPKSSTGRIDTFARVITDNCTNFDNVTDGYQGKLYLMVYPMSFDLIVKEGVTLSQIRFFQGTGYRLTAQQMREAYQQYQLLYDKNGHPLLPSQAILEEDGLFLTVDFDDDIVGYRSKKNSKPINTAKKGYYAVNEFWEPITRPPSKKLILDPDFFYILKSKEKVRIPTSLASEMVEFHSGIGEFRSHYAGFFDPGFGYGKDGEIKGSHAVLEVRMRDTPMEIIDGQIFVKMVFERMMDIPSISYGEGSSHYQNQSLKLSKHFVQ